MQLLQSSSHQTRSQLQDSLRQGLQNPQTHHNTHTHTHGLALQDLTWTAQGVNGNQSSSPATQATFSKPSN